MSSSKIAHLFSGRQHFFGTFQGRFRNVGAADDPRQLHGPALPVQGGDGGIGPAVMLRLGDEHMGVRQCRQLAFDTIREKDSVSGKVIPEVLPYEE